MSKDVNTLPIQVDTTPKGIRTIILDLDEFEMIETGVKEKEIDGKKIPVSYMKFKLVEKKVEK